MGKTLPPLVVPGPTGRAGWHSPGVRPKPQGCKNCKFAPIGYGFCPDQYVTGARCALLMAAPGADDCNAQVPLSGAMGWYVLKNFVEPAGFKREELVISHVLRCKLPWRAGKIAYPTGPLKGHAEGTCRQYDLRHGERGKLTTGGLLTFAPNVFILTFDPYDSRNTTAYHRQIQQDFRRASFFAARGDRPCLLMGKEAAEIHAPFIRNNGGLKTWRGHWFYGAPQEIVVPKSGEMFKEV